MSQRNQSIRPTMLPVWLSACAILLAAAAGVHGDSPGSPEEEVKKLIVMIRSTMPSGDEEVGAGIIFSQQGNSLYIVTANHVVRQGMQDAKVRVRIRTIPGKSFDAQLLDDSDASADWAVLEVANVELPAGGLPFAQLGDANSLDRDANVFLIGNPGGRAWELTVRPVGVTRKTSESIWFESSLLQGGYSGGALLDDQKGIVGLLKSDQPPHGEALNIQGVLSILEERGYAMRLKPREGSSPSAPDRLSFHDWEGSWSLQWEYEGQWYEKPMTLTADQSGITGEYGLGTVKGTYENGDISTVTGEYTNTSGTGVDCPSGKQTGSFTLNLKRGGKSMEGWWDICGKGTQRRWKAEKRDGISRQ